MTSVHRPYRTPNELRNNSEVSDGEAIQRVVRVAYVITQPLMAAASVTTRLVLIRQRFVRPRWYVIGASVVLIVALLSGTVRPYVRPAFELFNAARSAGGLAGVWPAVGAVASTNWASWVAGCLPLAIAGGVFIGAVRAATRARRLPVWRDDKALDVPKDRRIVLKKVAALVPATQNVGVPFLDVEVHLGLDETTHKAFALTTKELWMHAYLDGPSGFGKTTTLIRLVDGLVSPAAIRDRRVPVVVITMKPDRDTTEAVRAIAAAAGRKFWHITHDGRDSATYNPLGIGTAHEVSSAVMEAEAQAEAGGFSEPHHRAAGERYLQLVVQALTELSSTRPLQWFRDYPTLAKLMRLEELTQQQHYLSPRLAQRLASYQQELNAEKRLRDSLAGLRQRVARAAESAAGAVIREDPAGLVLETAIEAGDVVMFNLDAAADTSAAQLIGNLALQDLVRTMARLGSKGWHFNEAGDVERIAFVAVDEFSALGGTLLADLFQRARGQGAGVLLSTQEAGSLDLAGPAFREAVITSANVLLLHRQTVNAETFAGYLGTESYLIETRQLFEERSLIEGHQVYASGQGNAKQGERYRLHPNVLRRLAVGELMVRVGSRSKAERPALVAVQQWKAPTGSGEPSAKPARGNPPAPKAPPTSTSVTADELEPVDVEDNLEPASEGWVWAEDDTDLDHPGPPHNTPVGSS